MANNNFSMLEFFEAHGIWWRGTESDNVSTGKLTFNPQNGIRVEVSNRIDPELGKKNISSSDLIYGELDDGTKVTLIDCVEVIKHLLTTTNEKIPSSLRARQCLIGAHITKGYEFTVFDISIENYLQFYCRTGIRPPDDGYGFVWNKVKPSEFYIEGDKIVVNLIVTSRNQLFESSHTIDEKAIIRVELKNPVKDIDEAILGVIRTLKSMLEISLGYPVPIIGFKVWYKEANGRTGFVNVLYAQSARKTEKEAHPIHDMLFSFCRRSEENIQSLIDRWNDFSKANKFTIDTIIYSGAKGESGKRLEQSFFFLIGSIEALHEAYGKKKNFLGDDDFKVIKKSLFKIIPSGTIGNKFREKIGGMNKVALRERLYEVLDSMPEIVSNRIADKKILVNNLIGQRTIFAHHIVRSEIDVLSTWHLTEVLWGITMTYILIQLQLSEEEINDIINSKINMLNAFHWIEQCSTCKLT